MKTLKWKKKALSVILAAALCIGSVDGIDPGAFFAQADGQQEETVPVEETTSGERETVPTEETTAAEETASTEETTSDGETASDGEGTVSTESTAFAPTTESPETVTTAAQEQSSSSMEAATKPTETKKPDKQDKQGIAGWLQSLFHSSPRASGLEENCKANAAFSGKGNMDTLTVQLLQNSIDDTTHKASFSLKLDALLDTVGDDIVNYHEKFETAFEEGWEGQTDAEGWYYGEPITELSGDAFDKIIQTAEDLTGSDPAVVSYTFQLKKEVTTDKAPCALSMVAVSDQDIIYYHSGKGGDWEYPVGKYSIQEQDGYYDITVSLNNAYLCVSPSEFGFTVNMEFSGNVDADTTYELVASEDILSMTAGNLWEEPETTTPSKDKVYTISKQAQSHKADDFTISYVIKVGTSDAANYPLTGMVVRDKGPVVGAADDPYFKLISAEIAGVTYKDDTEKPLSLVQDTTDGTFFYTIPDTADAEQSITLTYGLTDEKLEKYISEQKIDIKFKNTAELYEGAGGSTDPLKTASSGGETIKAVFYDKKSAVDKNNPQVLHWTITLNTRFTHATQAYLIDWLSAGNQVYVKDSLKIKKTNEKGETTNVSVSIDASDISVADEYGDLTVSDVKGFYGISDDTTIPSGDAKHLKRTVTEGDQYGLVIPLPDFGTEGAWTGGTYTITYDTELTSTDYEGSITGGTTTKATNDAKVVYSHFCTGTGPGTHEYAADITINKEQPVVYKPFSKTFIAYNKNTQIATYQLDINRYGVQYDSIVIRDQLPVHSEAGFTGAEKRILGLYEGYLDPASTSITVTKVERSDASKKETVTLNKMSGIPNPTGSNSVAEGYYIDEANNTIYFCLNNVSKDHYYLLDFKTKVYDTDFLKLETEGYKITNTADMALKMPGKEWRDFANSSTSEKPLENALFSKASEGYDYSTNRSTWLLEVNTNTVPIQGLTVTDFLPEGTTFEKVISIEAMDETQAGVTAGARTAYTVDNEENRARTGDRLIAWSYVEAESTAGYSQDELTFIFTTGENEADHSAVESKYRYYIKLSLITDENYRKDKLGKKDGSKLVNRAAMTGTVHGAAVSVSDMAEVAVSYSRIEKSGKKLGDGSSDLVQWTVNFNRDAVDMNGRVLSDDLTNAVIKGNLEFDVEQEIAIYAARVDAAGKFTKADGNNISGEFVLDSDYTGFRLTIPETYRRTPLIIEFKTNIIKNTAKVTNKLYLDGEADADNSGNAISSEVTTNNFSYDSYANNSALPKIYVTKKAADGSALANAEFQAEFFLAGKTRTKLKSSAANGQAKIIGLKYDLVITLTETKAPDGFSKDAQAYYFVFLKDKAREDFASDPHYEDIIFVTGTNKAELTMTNYPIGVVQPVRLIKTYEDTVLTALTESDRDTLLAGTEFTVYSDDACTAALATASPVWTGRQAQVSFTGLSASTTCYLKETKSPVHYDLNPAVYVCRIDDKGAAGYKLLAEPDTAYSSAFPVCENKKTIYAEPVQLIKTYEGVELSTLAAAERNSILASTEFTLYKDSDCTDVAAAAKRPAWDSAERRAAVVFDTGLSISTTYYLKETKAPVDYDLSPAVYVCRIGADGIVNYKLSTEEDSAYQAAFPVCENRKTVYADTVKLIKSYEEVELKTLGETERNSFLLSTEFTLYRDAACTDKLAAAKPEWDRTEQKAVVQFDGKTLLEKGKLYYLKETKTPVDYDLAESTWVCKIDALTGIVSYKLSTEADSAYRTSFPICENKKTVYADTVKLIKSYEEVELKTLDETERTSFLSGTEFTLYKDAACTDKLAAAKPEWDGTEQKAVVQFDGKTLLEKGKLYYLKETKTPVDYDLAESTWVCKIDALTGIVSYKLSTEADSAYRTSFPICENKKTVYADTVKLIKSYEEVELKTLDETERTSFLSGTEFTLYKDAACTDKLAAAKPEWDGTEQKAVVQFDGKTLLEKGKLYYLKETKTLVDYDLAESVWVCKIDALTGIVSYKLSAEADSAYRTSFPVCENKKTIYADTVKLIKSYEEVELKTLGETERTSFLLSTEFTLYRDVACTDKLAAAKPEWDGTEQKAVVQFDGKTLLEKGKLYYLKETESPVDYDLAESVWVCKIDALTGIVSYKLSTEADSAYRTSFPVCENKKTIYTGDVQLIKSYEATDLMAMEEAERNALLNATEFTIFKGSGCLETEKLASAAPVWSEEKALVVFDGKTLLEKGRLYYLKETAAPQGYDCSKNIWVCEVDGQTGEISYKLSTEAVSAFTEDAPVCENRKHVAELCLIKSYQGTELTALAETARKLLLDSTVFTLYSDEACTQQLASASPIWKNEQAAVVFDEGLRVGNTYYLQETTAPSRYRRSTQVYVCRVNLDGSISYRLSGQADEEFSGEFPSCENKKKSSGGSSGGGSSSGGSGGSSGPSGPSITTPKPATPENIQQSADNTVTTTLPSGNEVIIELDEGGKIVTDGVPEGSYQFTQNIADPDDVNNPYFKNPVFQVTVEKENGEKIAKDESGKRFELGEQDLSEYIKKSDISGVVKTESGASLQNVILGIFPEDTQVFDKEHLLNGMTVVTDENGTFVFENIPYGKYKVVEMSVPEGYEVLEDNYGVHVNRHAYLFTISESGQELQFIHMGGEAIPLAAPTGDSMQPLLWLGLMGLAAAALLAAMRKKKTGNK